MNKKDLTERERYMIEFLLQEKITKREIANRLGISESCLYKEIKRGTVELIDSDLRPYKKYCADTAQMKADKNKSNKGRPWKISNDYDFVRYVEYMIHDMRFSPDAVLMDIARNGYQFKTKVCKTTLYNYIHSGVFLNISDSDLAYHKKKKKVKKVCRKVSLKNPIKPSIENRPDIISDRAEYGHWEMDTVYSSHKNRDKNCLLVLTERKTRDEIVMKMKNRKSESVVKALDKLYRMYGKKKFHETFKTITCDNGSEFSDIAGMVKNNRFDIYFCHPFCSSERATNENQNKLIRRWIKKGDDIKNYSDSDIRKIQDWMNNYPRRLFNGLSSREYSALCTK